MLRLDLHIHTEHSFDCRSPVEAVIRKSEVSGLNAIAICDHHTLSAVTLARKLTERLMIIPASEIHTEQGAHIIGLFLKEEIHSRDILDVINEIHSQKGLVLLPHPYRPDTGFLYLNDEKKLASEDKLGQVLVRIDLVELATLRCRPDEVVRTNDFLKFYPDLPQVVSSNAHQSEEIGRAYVELDVEGVKNLGDLKSAILTAPRLLRFEVCREESGWETQTAPRPHIRHGLVKKTGRLLAAPIRNTVGNIYRKSSERFRKKREIPTEQKSASDDLRAKKESRRK